MSALIVVPDGVAAASQPATRTSAIHGIFAGQMRGACFWTVLTASLALAWSLPAHAAAAPPINPPLAHVTETTAGGSDLLASVADLPFSQAPPSAVPVIAVDSGETFQTVRGFGAALTDSSAWLIHDRLKRPARARLLGQLFGPGGLHLQFLRLPIGASDFTAHGRPYTYDDLPPGHSDPLLSHFSISHDRPYIIPTVLKALSIDPGIEIMATPWTAPPWMKANDSFDNTAFSGTLLRSAFAPLADYFVRFIRAYAAAGIRITAVTPQNEPQGQSLFPGMRLPWRAQAIWIRRYLRPALRAAGLRTEVYGADVGWGAAAYQEALVRSLNRGAINGVAWHCYGGSPAAMRRLSALAPRLDQVVSECAIQITPYTVPQVVAESLRYGASTVALWNLALDPWGGPVQPPDSGCPGCRGLVTIEPRTRTVRYTLGYYQLGQFSRFIMRGARVIGSSEPRGIDDVAVRNPDGSVVLVAYNASPAQTAFAVGWNHEYLAYALPPGATATFRWN